MVPRVSLIEQGTLERGLFTKLDDKDINDSFSFRFFPNILWILHTYYIRNIFIPVYQS